MGYIPSDAEWYLADVIIEICVEDDPRRVVCINTLLVRADSPEQAYQEALLLGRREEGEPYLNSKGKQVTSRFVGLKDLAVIHEKLEHGAELFFTEYLETDLAEVQAMATVKEKLAVFADIPNSDRPDYGCGLIEADYQKAVRNAE